MKILSFLLEVKGGKTLVESLASTKNELTLARKEVTSLNKELNKLKASQGASADSIKKVTDKLTEQTASVANLEQSSRKLNNQLKQQVLTFQNQKDKVPTDSLNGLRLSLIKLTDTYGKLSKAERRTAEGKLLQKNISNTKKEIDKLTASLGDYRSQVGNYAKSSANFGRNVLSSFGLASGAQIFARVFSDALKTIIDFDRQITNLGVITQGTDRELLKLRQSALSLGATTAFTANQVVELQTELAKLGFTTTEILNSTKAVIDFSVTTQSEVPRAAALAGAALRAYNKDSSEMTQVLGTLAVATTKSALDFRKLETEIPVVATTAAALNVSLEETVGVLGILANSGLDASTAATSFRNILLESAQAGVNYKDLIKQVAESTNQAKTAFELFGKRGVAAALTLAATGDAAEKLQASITNVGGQLEIFAAQQLQSVSGRITLAKSAWEGFILSLEDGKGPVASVAKSVIDSFTGILNSLTALNTISAAEIFEEEKNELISVLFTLKSYENNKERQAVVLEQLKKQYPQYIDYLDTENLSNNQIVESLKTYNKLNEDKYKGLENEAELNALLKEQESIINKITEARRQQVNASGDDAGFFDIAKGFGSDKLISLLDKQLFDVEAKLKSVREEAAKLKKEVGDPNSSIIPEYDEKDLVTLSSLRDEQTRLKEVIDDSSISSDRYNEAIREYLALSKKIDIENKKLSVSTKEAFKVGTIGYYREEISKLKKAIDEGGDLSASVGKLIEAENNLAILNERIQEARDQYESDNLLSLPIARRIDILKESYSIELKLKSEQLKATINNEDLLQASLKETEALYTNSVAAANLLLLKKGTKEYEAALLELSRTAKEAGLATDNIKLVTANNDITELENYLAIYYSNSIDSEVRLQEQLTLINLKADEQRLQNSLDLGNLSNEARIKAEKELLALTKQIKDQQGLLNSNFSQDTIDLNKGEASDITKLVPEFSPDNVSASLAAIKDFRERKAIIEQEYDLKRLQETRELYELQGKDLTDIDYQIASKKLEISELTNAALIKNEEDRLAAEQKISEQRVALIESSFDALADIIGNSLDGTYEDAKERQKAFVGLLLDTVEKIILLQIASASAQSYAQGDSVTTFGVTGTVRAAILAGLIRASFAGVKALVLSSFEQGGNIRSTNQQDLKNGTIFRGRKHTNGGEHFLVNGRLNEAQADEAIIKDTATNKWKGLLSAINMDGGGNNFAGSESYRWLPFLSKAKGNYHEDGNLLGSNIANNIPYLLDRPIVGNNSYTDNRELLVSLFGQLEESNTLTLNRAVESIVDKMVMGLDKNRRLSERYAKDKNNGKI